MLHYYLCKIFYLRIMLLSQALLYPIQQSQPAQDFGYA